MEFPKMKLPKLNNEPDKGQVKRSNRGLKKLKFLSGNLDNKGLMKSA